MPRKRSKTIQVIPFDPLTKAQWHLCRVSNLDVLPRARGLRLTLEHAEEAHAGRTHTVQLPQLRPAGLTHELLTAAGIDVVPDKDIDLAEAEGVLVRVRFRSIDDGSYEPVAFRAIDKDRTHDQQR